ncbi:nuclear GTPase SLIP-GC-like [Trematomus bernacchii]|uniref:nuclear GTPase SLIP-GC-like n=1 Tax=Trematomus bernacchii TaxID=40690 RepID=UPI00146F3B16|nr:nuclear GTPase SLIP-GC-like [Trematomus bernacchii]
MWKKVVGSCSTVWIVAEINRAASEKESWEILEESCSLMGNGRECQQIHLICTKSDSLGGSDDQSAADVRALILKQNEQAKIDVKAEFSKLKDVKEFLLPAVRLDPMFQAVKLPAGIANLHTSLTNVD